QEADFVYIGIARSWGYGFGVARAKGVLILCVPDSTMCKATYGEISSASFTKPTIDNRHACCTLEEPKIFWNPLDGQGRGFESRLDTIIQKEYTLFVSSMPCST
ncbi:unnamed protein product, partial [Ectocarpus sp. 12 AP-2014]